eukprot:TRINITY_DN122181_c0_g1_i1.p1 TRINITY_DN122181_c0_g1~~TRINITY_DN122181_c0_g1_i1.p1  ORF type:complete len:1067 (-),score=210.45 TRINITY_DN122181_c0_g1_i1:12-3212(-)
MAMACGSARDVPGTSRSFGSSDVPRRRSPAQRCGHRRTAGWLLKLLVGAAGAAAVLWLDLRGTAEAWLSAAGGRRRETLSPEHAVKMCGRRAESNRDMRQLCELSALRLRRRRTSKRHVSRDNAQRRWKEASGGEYRSRPSSDFGGSRKSRSKRRQDDDDYYGDGPPSFSRRARPGQRDDAYLQDAAAIGSGRKDKKGSKAKDGSYMGMDFFDDDYDEPKSKGEDGRYDMEEIDFDSAGLGDFVDTDYDNEDDDSEDGPSRGRRGREPDSRRGARMEDSDYDVERRPPRDAAPPRQQRGDDAVPDYSEDEDDDYQGYFGESSGRGPNVRGGPRTPYKGFWERRDLGRVSVSDLDTRGEFQQLSIEELEQKILESKQSKRQVASPLASRLEDDGRVGNSRSGAAEPRGRDGRSREGSMAQDRTRDAFDRTPKNGPGGWVAPVSATERAAKRKEMEDLKEAFNSGGWGQFPPEEKKEARRPYLGSAAIDEYGERMPAEPIEQAPEPVKEEPAQKKGKFDGWLLPEPSRRAARDATREQELVEAKVPVAGADFGNVDRMDQSKFAKMYKAAMRRLQPLPWHEVENINSWTDLTNETWESIGINGTPAATKMLGRMKEFKVRNPNVLQARALPQLMSGKDAMMTSMTGSGKTLAFLVPLLAKYALPHADEDPLAPYQNKKNSSAWRYAKPRLMIVAPSRELAAQIASVVGELLEPFPYLGSVLLVGGGNHKIQDQKLKNRQPIVVVGTPGRILDHATEGRLVLKELEGVVFDEVDQLLNVSRQDHADMMVDMAQVASGAQRVLVSATGAANPIAMNFADYFLREPWHLIGPSQGFEMPPRILHLVNGAPDMEKKIMFLLRLIKSTPTPQGVMVFCNNFERARKVAEQLRYRGEAAEFLSGNRTHAARQAVVYQMQKGNIDFLVATDVATRGLDFRELTHVVNFELPGSAVSYAHRAGRCGRTGRNGVVVSLASGGANNLRLQKYASELFIDLHEANVDGGFLGVIETKVPRAARSRKRSALERRDDDAMDDSGGGDSRPPRDRPVLTRSALLAEVEGGASSGRTGDMAEA